MPYMYRTISIGECRRDQIPRKTLKPTAHSQCHDSASAYLLCLTFLPTSARALSTIACASYP